VPVPARATVSVRGASVNVAATLAGPVTLTEQAPTPEQPPPDQPAKFEPTAGLAVRTTAVPWLKLSLQSGVQSIPSGLEPMLPFPLPDRVTVNGYWLSVNVAVTDVAAVTVSTQGPVPLHSAPDHPENVEPGAAAATSVRRVPSSKSSLQSAPQSMPAMLEETVPIPFPALSTVRENWGGASTASSQPPVARTSTSNAARSFIRKPRCVIGPGDAAESA
jgi:hypothetical protein